MALAIAVTPFGARPPGEASVPRTIRFGGRAPGEDFSPSTHTGVGRIRFDTKALPACLLPRLFSRVKRKIQSSWMGKITRIRAISSAARKFPKKTRNFLNPRSGRSKESEPLQPITPGPRETYVQAPLSSHRRHKNFSQSFSRRLAFIAFKPETKRESFAILTGAAMTWQRSATQSWFSSRQRPNNFQENARCHLPVEQLSACARWLRHIDALAGALCVLCVSVVKIAC